MKKTHKLIIVGDRVLIQLRKDDEQKTNGGLILPDNIADMAVQVGQVVAVGPGIPIGADDFDADEPWKRSASGPRYFPTQAKEGDIATFFKKAAVEIKSNGNSYLVVPHQAILILARPTNSERELGEFNETQQIES